jgi:hypothetical protein
MITKNRRKKKMKEEEILIVEKKKPYQKPELVVHGSVEKITEQISTHPGGMKVGLSGNV